MAGGSELPGIAAPAARRRGRPPGATNKRSKDLAGYFAATFGASAAQQSAALCMVTRGELRAAGGSMAQAMVSKAADLVELVRRAQAGRDETFRETIREEFERLLLDVREVTGRELRQAMDVALKRVREAGGGFSLREAMELLSKERAALLPYTDKRQPLAIDVAGEGLAPSVVFQLGQVGGQAMPTDAEFVELFGPAEALVSQPMSHDDSEAAEFVDVPTAPATD